MVTFRYWRKALASVARNLRVTPGFAHNLAVSGLRQDARPLAPTRFILDAYPDCEGLAVEMGSTAYRRSNLDPMEQFVLGALTRLRQPRRILEIGTYDGASTLLMLRNAPDAEILTLDLAPNDAAAATVEEETANAIVGVGSRFRGTSDEHRVHQLLGDSRTFDFSPWYDSVDLVLVDAGHEYDCAKSDTDNAYRVLAPGGIIVWDDYQVGWPGVVKAVDESPKPKHRHILHVAGTDFAVYDSLSIGETA